MKQIFSLLVLIFLLFGCGNGDCVKCEKQLPNSTTTVDLCQEGADVSFSQTLIGVGSDTLLLNTTVADQSAKLTSAGFTCK